MKDEIPPPKFGADKTDPFKGDLLNREQEIKVLTPRIIRIASPAIMSLDAEWGAGKTAFINMWKTYLNNQVSTRAFYFNAWETDFAADPLVPFVETITAEMTDESQKLMESVKAFAPAIGDVVGRAAGAGVFVDATKKIAEQFFAPRGELEKFKDAIKAFIKSQEGKRVVIFVDELDRCRPDYAVKTLERIKHLFDVPEVIFVLATNREQLCHSINALYGAKFNAQKYLRRFIGFDYKIKQPNMNRFIAVLLEKLEIDKFVQKMEESDYTRKELQANLELQAKIHGFTLRDMKQLLRRIVFVLDALDKNNRGKYKVNPDLLAFLIVARLQMRDIYDKYIHYGNSREIIDRWESDFFAANSILWQDERARDHIYDTAGFITANIIMARGLLPPDRSVATDIMIADYEKKAASALSRKKLYYEKVAQYIGRIDKNEISAIDLRSLANKIEMLDRIRLSDDDGAEDGGD